MIHRHLVKKVEIRFIISDIKPLVLYNITIFLKKRIAQWLADRYNDKGLRFTLDILRMTEEDFIV